MGLQFGQKKQPAHFKTKVQAAFAFLGRPKQPKGYLKTISKQPATHLAQTVRSNLRPAAFGLPHHKRHAAHAELSGEVCAVGNALLGLRFDGGVGQDFRCLRAADLSQYVGQYVRFRRVQAVFVAGFWEGARGFARVVLLWPLTLSKQKSC